MRPPQRSLLFFFLGPALWLPVFTAARAAPEVRTVDFINAGTQPVYALRVGHRATGEWSDDLLGPTEVVEIGDGDHVRVRLADTCWYDIRFEYGDGAAGELDDVDLCSASRVFLKGTAQ